MSELAKNIFTQHYSTPRVKKEDEKKSNQVITDVAANLKRYTHKDAIDFASSPFPHCSDYSNPKLPGGRDYSIQQYPLEAGTRAYYRVIVEKPDKYILAACHVNIHGHHRGDLKYVEINDRTVTRGTEKYSILGKLYLGDTVAVTQLARLRPSNSQDIFETTLGQPCTFMASRITVLNRVIQEKVKFSVLDIGAVVEGHTELMEVRGLKGLKPNTLYYGHAFIPHKMLQHFTEEHQESEKNELLAKCSKIHQPPNPLGTIFEVMESAELKEIFEIGSDAFKKSSRHNNSASTIVETCVLMGYSAANSVGYGRLDIRAFPIQGAKKFGRTLQFIIDNPPDKPTEGKWAVGNRIQIDGNTGEHCAVIETVLAQKKTLKISARLSKDVPNQVKFDKGLFIVSQREPMDIQILKKGFFKEIPLESNGRRIIEALYGGPKITGQKTTGRPCTYPAKPPVPLNKYQAEYVEMLLNPRNPIIVGSSPFGCGKSMTIVTAAFELTKQSGKIQLLITQSNFASVNLVEIARKLGPYFKFFRYISEKNAKEMPEDCLTDYDLTVIMKQEFLAWATNIERQTIRLENKHKFTILNFVLGFIGPEKLVGEALAAYSKLIKRRPFPYALLDAFFALYCPKVIMSTADSLQTLLSYNLLKKEQVSTIQIDEASQLPEYTFISLLTLFPHSTYGLIGDIQQLPPYCETGLEGKLKDYGVGNTMERAVEGGLFPQAMLRQVYRCHPRTTDLLSDLFYDGKLISGVQEHERNRFLQADFWPNPKFPVLIIHNRGKGNRMGTSCGNKSEKEIVKILLDLLTTNYNGYKLEESDIGVISFYKAQTSILTDALRGRDVKCGTVDAFQGTEREVIILCCTNETVKIGVQSCGLEYQELFNIRFYSAK